MCKRADTLPTAGLRCLRARLATVVSSLLQHHPEYRPMADDGEDCSPDHPGKTARKPDDNIPDLREEGDD